MSDTNSRAHLQVSIGDQGPWALDLQTMKVSEAEQCEALTGWEAEQWRDALFENRARAVKFAVWLARTRAGETVAWKDLDFDLADLNWDAVDENGDVVEAPAELGVTEEQSDALPTGSAEGETTDGE